MQLCASTQRSIWCFIDQTRNHCVVGFGMWLLIMFGPSQVAASSNMPAVKSSGCYGLQRTQTWNKPDGRAHAPREEMEYGLGLPAAERAKMLILKPVSLQRICCPAAVVSRRPGEDLALRRCPAFQDWTPEDNSFKHCLHKQIWRSKQRPRNTK